jgi:hypothetical protein
VLGHVISKGVLGFGWIGMALGKVHDHPNRETCAIRSNKFINSTIPLNVRKAWLIFQMNKTNNVSGELDTEHVQDPG